MVAVMHTPTLEHDGVFVIATGDDRNSTRWRNREVRLSELLARLRRPVVGQETAAEFDALPKTEQTERKDVGGYVGGALSAGRRQLAAVRWRQLLTLDVDHPSSTFLFDVDLLPYAWITHSTRHAGRYRLLIPVSRPTSRDEYRALCQHVMDALGPEQFDRAALSYAHMMFWPSVSSDGLTSYTLAHHDAPWLDVDEVLAVAPRVDVSRARGRVAEESLASRTEVREALARIDPSIERGAWIKVGLALCAWSEGEDYGLDLWDSWSAQAPDKYPGREEIEYQWSTFSPEGATGIGTLFHMSREALDRKREKGTRREPTGRGENPEPSPGEDRVFTIRSPLELLQAPRPRWLVRDVLPERGLAVIYGASGSGKSFAVLDLALSIVRGTPWMGRRVRRGRVVYVATEGALRGRVEAYTKAHEVPAEDLEGFGVVEESISLLAGRSDDAERLVDAVRGSAGEGETRLVVIDTLNRAMPGANENASEDMGAAIRAASQIQEALGCLVLLVHHSGKDESKGSRGHSSLKAATDAELSVAQTVGPFRAVSAEKVRDGEAGMRIANFRLDVVDLGAVSDEDPEADWDERYTSCVVRECEAPVSDPIERLSEREKAALKAFEETCRVLTNREAENFPEGPEVGCLEADWIDSIRSALSATLSADGQTGKNARETARTQAKRAAKKLQVLGIIEVSGGVAVRKDFAGPG